MGFDVGLLAGPTVEKRLALQMRRERTERDVFTGGEKPLSDLFAHEICPDVFEIDAYLSTVCHSIESQLVGVRHVEAQPLSAACGKESWFPIITRPKTQLTRR